MVVDEKDGKKDDNEACSNPGKSVFPSSTVRERRRVDAGVVVGGGDGGDIGGVDGNVVSKAMSLSSTTKTTTTDPKKRRQATRHKDDDDDGNDDEVSSFRSDVSQAPSTAKLPSSSLSLRTMYLSSLACIFLIAFVSYYAQYPGLLSTFTGIDPTGPERILPQTFPWLRGMVSFDRVSVEYGGARSSVASSSSMKMMLVDVDSLAELACVLGVILSCLAVSGIVQHGILFLFLTLTYQFLVVLGGQFYSFQWDILLLETGMITSLCVAPWLRLGAFHHPWRMEEAVVDKCERQKDGEGGNGDDDDGTSDRERPPLPSATYDDATQVGLWPLRFLLFKLMYMSGVVKVQSNCPTWHGLTALEYHFATQCLPGPFAWHMHQLHPLLLRLSVAATFVIEIPAPFLLICPWTTMRRVGAALQILLQVMIMMTGNYTYFNLLTIVLCLPCIEGNDGGGDEADDDDDEEEEEKKKLCKETMETTTTTMMTTSKGMTNRRLGTDDVRSHRTTMDRVRSKGRARTMQLVSCAAILWMSSTSMFRLENDRGNDDDNNGGGDDDPERRRRRRWNVSLAMTKDECDSLIERTVPLAVYAAFLFLAWDGTRLFLRQIRVSNRGGERRRMVAMFLPSLVVLCRTVVAAICVGTTSIPILTLTPGTDFYGSGLFIPMWRYARVYRLFGGYGLFRRMTGVGSVPPMPTLTSTNGSRSRRWGWAGMPPSIVARPEIILEGRVYGVIGDDEGKTNATSPEWRELKFRWKPGDVTRRPMQVAPHQPRLDWQMWFAALGQYQNNPWLLNLVGKILQGCPSVLNLLDEPELEAGTERLSHVRASLWHYDFTRIDSAWSRGIPGVARLVAGGGGVRKSDSVGDAGLSHDDDDNNDDDAGNDGSMFWTDFWSWPDRYWDRSPVRQYLPTIAAENRHPSVDQFLSAHGYPSGKCARVEDRCDRYAEEGHVLRFLCGATTHIRVWNMIWAPVVVLALWLAFIAWVCRFRVNCRTKTASKIVVGNVEGKKNK